MVLRSKKERGKGHRRDAKITPPVLSEDEGKWHPGIKKNCPDVSKLGKRNLESL